jgi:NAD(P)-dependent dehydrogenase (short-subunit alcohol dehydrogenase family)
MVAQADLTGKVALVTGATAGIGEVTAAALAGMGAAVVLVSRNPQKLAATAGRIRQQTGNPDVEWIAADLGVMANVVEAADEFKARHDRLHIVVNNAGAIYMTRQVTADGYELTFALNHLAYFLLTEQLLPVLERSAPARVVNVASEAQAGGRLNFDDLMGERKYSGFGAYSQSKLANVMFTYELARRLAGTGITANVLHPGFVASDFGRNNSGWMMRLFGLVRPFAISSGQGAQTQIYLASSPEVEGVTGQYFVKQKPKRSSRASYDTAAQKRLWDVSEQLVSRVLTATA